MSPELITVADFARRLKVRHAAARTTAEAAGVLVDISHGHGAAPKLRVQWVEYCASLPPIGGRRRSHKRRPRLGLGGPR